jgi:glycosyltransferase involved in cell wall biosynthesis
MGRRSVVFALTPYGSGGILIDPRDPTASSGGGGSRAGFMGLVRAVSRLGSYDVTAVSTFARARDEVDGVRYLQIDPNRPIPDADVQLAYYDTTPLVGATGRLRIGSHHTCTPPFDSWAWTDVNTAPCSWVVAHLRRNYRPYGRWDVIPNAVEGLEGVAWDPVPGKIVYHTSPDRGLHRLLRDIYPRVKERVPNATLDVVGDPAEVTRFARHPELSRSYEGERGRAMIEGLRASEAAGGLKMHGRLSRPALLRLLSSASCFAFPAEVSMPCETWSISVHECLAIGVPVVLSPVDALESLWGKVVWQVPPFPGGKVDVEEFVDSVVDVLSDPAAARYVSGKAWDHVAPMTFDASARAFDRIVEEWFAERPATAAAE